MRDTLYVVRREAHIEVIISRLYTLRYDRSSIRELFLLLSLINLYKYKLKYRSRYVETLLINSTIIIKTRYERRFFLDLLLFLLI